VLGRIYGKGRFRVWSGTEMELSKVSLDFELPNIYCSKTFVELDITCGDALGSQSILADSVSLVVRFLGDEA